MQEKHFSISIENQEMPDLSLKSFLEAKERYIEFYFHQCGSMFLKDEKNIWKWNLKEQIKYAEKVQYELENDYNKFNY